MKRLLLSFVIVTFLGTLTFLISKPTPVFAVCNEGYLRTTEAECQAICEGGTCVPREATSGPARTRYECTSCPAPVTGTCRAGTTTMSSARDCSERCGSGICVGDTAGVQRCCVIPDSIDCNCSSDSECGSGRTCDTGASAGCRATGGNTGVCISETEAGGGGTLTPGEGLPEQQEEVCIAENICIPTAPGALAGWALGFGLGLGALLAIMYIIIGGFGVVTSSGNPDNLEKAKKQITAAVAGLVFILLTSLILSTISGIIGIEFSLFGL